MPSLDYNQAVAAVRAEIAKYYDEDFSNTDNLSADLGILSDDLSAVALSLEKRTGVKLDSKDYREIATIESWARAIQRKSER